LHQRATTPFEAAIFRVAENSAALSHRLLLVSLLNWPYHNFEDGVAFLLEWSRQVLSHSAFTNHDENNKTKKRNSSDGEASWCRLLNPPNLPFLIIKFVNCRLRFWEYTACSKGQEDLHPSSSNHKLF
jgi:hypothetical protein